MGNVEVTELLCEYAAGWCASVREDGEGWDGADPPLFTMSFSMAEWVVPLKRPATWITQPLSVDMARKGSGGGCGGGTKGDKQESQVDPHTALFSSLV